MPVDPSSIQTAMPGEVIMTDRPCVRCGYNLKGLETGGSCPECGAPMVAKRSVRTSDSLVYAPIGYIRLIALGLGLQAATILGVTVLLILRQVAGGVRIGGVDFSGLLMTGAFFTWFAAAWLVTLTRPKTDGIVPDPVLDNKPIRLATRGSQALAFVAVVIGWIGIATGIRLITGFAGFLMIGALFGLVPLGVYLSSLADWAGEVGEGARLRTATWCIAVCGSLQVVLALVLMINPPFALLLMIGFVVCTLAVVGGVLMFAFSVMMLAKAAAWAIQNAVSSREREIRIAEKKQRQAMRDAARAQAAAEAMEAAAPPPPESFEGDPSVIPFDDAPIPLAGGPGRSKHEHVIDRTLDSLRRGEAGQAPGDPGGSDIYELEPDDEENGPR